MGVKVSPGFILGEWGLAILLYASDCSKHSVSFSTIKVLCQRNRKDLDFKKLLEKEVVNLEELLCPKIKNMRFYKKTPVCDLHAIRCPRRQLNKHCAKKKTEFFYYWLTNESSIRQNISSVNTSSEFVSKFNSLQLHNVWKPFDCHFCEGDKNWFAWTNCTGETTNQFLWRWKRIV